jgi:hypothetical protein
MSLLDTAGGFFAYNKASLKLRRVCKALLFWCFVSLV